MKVPIGIARILFIQALIAEIVARPSAVLNTKINFSILQWSKRTFEFFSKLLPGDSTEEYGQFALLQSKWLLQLEKTVAEFARNISEHLQHFTTGLDTKSLFKDRLEFLKYIRAIYPGTYWCGDGNIASDEENLGLFNNTDSCCREHDHCDDSIPAGEDKYGLNNTGFFTRSHCDCDTKFYNCLKAVNSIISNKIGFTYFSLLGPQCFKSEFPVNGCKEKTTLGRCSSYDLNDKESKKMQWFDNLPYLPM